MPYGWHTLLDLSQLTRELRKPLEFRCLCPLLGMVPLSWGPMKSSIRSSRHLSWRQWTEGRLPGGSILIETLLSQRETLSKFQDFRGMLVRYGDVSGGISIIVST